MSTRVQTLVRERDHLLAQLGALGPFRRGSVVENSRRCGKPGCHCADPSDAGHVRFLWTASIDGRGHSRHLATADEAVRVRTETERYKEFQRLSQALIVVNEQLCDLEGATTEEEASKKKRQRRSPKK